MCRPHRISRIVERRILQLEIEKVALEKETDSASKERLGTFVEELAVLHDLAAEGDDEAGAVGTAFGHLFGEGFDPSEYRLLLIGLAMVAMIVWRPRGLISERMPSVSLGQRRAVSGAHVSEGHG